MSHYAVHIPIDKDMRFFPKYVRKGLSDKDAAYASLVEGMDKSLGDIMNWLQRNGEAENTCAVHREMGRHRKARHTQRKQHNNRGPLPYYTRHGGREAV